MAVQTMSPPSMMPPDPDFQMGQDLLAIQRRIKRTHAIEVTLVWLALIALLSITLMFLNFEPAYVAAHWQFVVTGVWTTIALCLISIAIATILALLGALGRMSENPIANGVAGFYVSLIRGTPLLIQIYLIYLGLPQIGSQFRALGYNQLADLFTLTAFQSGVLALSLNYGAYMTEIFRAGLQSISFGQREAAVALGMNRWQTMRRVILPQGVRIIIPDIGNQFIAMQKDTAQVSVMGIWELTFRANRMARQDSKFMEMLLLAALTYWVLTIVTSWMQSRLEHRMAQAYER